MCRLFGFRSVIPSQVHSSLVAADNALGTQSSGHPDGWGVAYYVDGTPHLTKSPQRALGDQLFHRLSGIVSSQTVIAHVRKATQGESSVLNCHPFQYGRWVFAHNGDVPGYSALRAHLLEEVAPHLRRFVLGDTDSETIFFIFLSCLERYGKLRDDHLLCNVAEALRDCHAIVSRLWFDSPKPPSTSSNPAALGAEQGKELLLTMMVSNGDVLAALQGGKELFVSTYKRRCSERERCKSLSAECEAPSRTGLVNHLIVSSEPLSGENVWQELAPGEIVGVDGGMRMLRTTLTRRALPLVS